MDRGAWWATVHEVAKESNMTERLNNNTVLKECMKIVTNVLSVQHLLRSTSAMSTWQHMADKEQSCVQCHGCYCVSPFSVLAPKLSFFFIFKGRKHHINSNHQPTNGIWKKWKPQTLTISRNELADRGGNLSISDYTGIIVSNVLHQFPLIGLKKKKEKTFMIMKPDSHLCRLFQMCPVKMGLRHWSDMLS